MSDFVVVDASVAFKWLVEEENSDKATALTRLWDDHGTQPMPSTDGSCEKILCWKSRKSSCRTYCHWESCYTRLQVFT